MTSPIEAAERRWRWAGGALHVVHWGEEDAVFHEPSASTHLLDADTSLVVSCLRAASSPTDTAQLWRLAFGDEPEAGDCQTLSESLEGLARIGLVTSEAS